jgi:glycosyltransferase involved in cell wall biosynthesis
MESTIVAVLAGLGVLASLFWFGQLIEALRYRKQAVWLAEVPSDPPPDGRWPSVSILFAARDEAEMVGQATRSMLAQDYPDVRVVAVDDRSTDDTGAILDAIAGDDGRLDVVHVRDLPAGWLGKTHALHEAAGSATSRWLLFTDADVVFDPTALRRAIALAERAAIDHLTVVPDTVSETLGERAFLAMFFLIFNSYAPPRKVNDPRSKAAAGVGAFNLVRSEAFHAIGGFRRLAMSVDEDMRLGQALKFAGYRGLVALGKGLVSVRWHVGLGGMIRGLEKNFFAGAGYRLTVVVVAVFGLLTVGIAPYAGLFVGPWWTRAVCALGIGSVALTLAQLKGQGGASWSHALVLPLGALACALALVRSAILAEKRRGIRWRDHHYPLDELRAHVRLRNAWAREVWRSTR